MMKPKKIPLYAQIVSLLNVEQEAVRAFYTSLINHQSVDQYIFEHRLRFCSRQVEGYFLNHVLALTELTLDLPGKRPR